MKQFEVTAKIRNNLLKERRGNRSIRQLCETIGCGYAKYGALENLRESPLVVDQAEIRKRGVCIMCGDTALRPMLKHRRLCRMHYDAAPSSEELTKWLDMQPKQWRPITLQVAEYYNVEPKELFPDDVLFIRQHEAIVKLDASEIMALRGDTDTAKALVGEILSPEAAITRLELEQTVDTVLQTLSPREETIIRQRFGLAGNGAPKTLIELGEERGIQPERVRQLEARALRKLRHPSRSRRLRPYVDES